MKNILFTLALLISFNFYSQGVDNLPSQIYLIKADNHIGSSNYIEVPEGKYWLVNLRSGTGNSSPNFNSYIFFSYIDSSTEIEETPESQLTSPNYNGLAAGNLIPAGLKFWIDDSFTAESHFFYIKEYNQPSNGSLSYNNNEFINSVKLFPNPTTSTVSLNSEKDYDIEVFDMLGNKVMEFTGNSINMSNLSNAMYIVKAFDKIEKTSASYKVVKN